MATHSNASPPPDSNPNDHHPSRQSKIHNSLERYWKSNAKIMAVLLVIWAAVGLGCGVLIADWLNQFQLFGSGFPLGFWFAHQGSIIVFVLLILTYCLMMNRLDRQHHQELENLKKERSA